MLGMIIVSALLIGATLGILGAGGAILTMPALLFFTAMDEKTAVAHSLVIVGVIALAGWMLNSVRNPGNFSWRLFGIFALTSLPGAAVGAIAGASLPGGVQLTLLVMIMFFSAYKILGKKQQQATRESRLPVLLPAGFGTGAITGLVGVGGGFLMVPALHLLAGLPLKNATVTSLGLIVLNTAAAILALTVSQEWIEWDLPVLIIMAAGGVAGTLAAVLVSHKISAARLQQGFAMCLIVIASVLVGTRLLAA